MFNGSLHSTSDGEGTLVYGAAMTACTLPRVLSWTYVRIAHSPLSASTWSCERQGHPNVSPEGGRGGMEKVELGKGHHRSIGFPFLPSLLG